ncbi:MAG: DMT family transporter [Cocleimonas sp.]
MKLFDLILLITLAAIWGSSFIFMRASVEVFGPIALIAVRIIIAAACMFVFLFKKKRFHEFIQHWKVLFLVGLFSSAVSFSLLAYASLSLTGGTVSILNAMTPIFTALIAHFALNILMNRMQFFGMFISIIGLLFLVWDKVSWNIDSWLPALAGVGAALLYGVSNNLSKKYLSEVSIFTSSSGSLLFSAIFMSILLQFFMPDLNQISSRDWLYAIVLGVICTALAYVIHFKLIKSIGPTRASTVTFLIPIFSFIWGYLLLNEQVTPRMIGATAIILFGMSLVMGFLKLNKSVNT